MSVALTHMLGLVKVSFIFFYRDDLIRIMKTLSNQKLRYECCLEKDFFPGRISHEYELFGRKCIFIFLSVATIGILASYVPPTLVALQYDENNPESYIPDYMPYRAWMPFKIDASTKTYLLAVLYEAIPLYSFAYSIIATDCLFINIINYITMHLKTIRGAMTSIRERTVKKINGPDLTPDGLYNSRELNEKMKQEMNKIIQHLQEVYRVSEDLETVHTGVTLAQIFSTLFIICSCLYLVSTTPVSDKLYLSELLYLFAMTFQLTIYCMFGNAVTQEAEEVPDSIFQCDWLTADKDFKNSCLYTMVRAGRPLVFTAGKFVPLTFGTYVSVMKAAYSTFAVIKNTSK
ncbi:odorant receptor 2a-like [Diabrotica undecimpunctata]|uniref:odorant receptor 2a-like n=1 Tax=Diabrotica undecimpunctata TaxID=50387 RepID=UPI003B641AC9